MFYSKCMGSHVARDITMPRTVWMVRLCLKELLARPKTFEDGQRSNSNLVKRFSC